MDETQPTANPQAARQGTRWRQSALRAAARADSRFDDLRRRFYGRMGVGQPYTICSYIGYGAMDKNGRATVKLRGRVLVDPPNPPPMEGDTVWANLLATYRRLENTQLAGGRVEIALGGSVVEAITDSEGYYSVEVAGVAPPAGPWLTGQVRLVDPAGETPSVETVRAVVPQSADFAVISDIDDTILVSDVTHWLRAARRLFLQNARSRLAFPGVAEFYQALQRGAGPASFNPIFYLSASPWNLYDLLADFMAFNAIPAGPIFLRNYSAADAAPGEVAMQGGLAGHKRLHIEQLLADFPNLPFVLLGDSGQKDPAIYAEVAARHPDRVRAIYIRDVEPGASGARDQARDDAFAALAHASTSHGVPMMLMAESAAALAHAAQIGLVAGHADEVDGVDRVSGDRPA